MELSNWQISWYEEATRELPSEMEINKQETTNKDTLLVKSFPI
jgi:hypothetical protein